MHNNTVEGCCSSPQRRSAPQQAKINEHFFYFFHLYYLCLDKKIDGSVYSNFFLIYLGFMLYLEIRQLKYDPNVQLNSSIKSINL